MEIYFLLTKLSSLLEKLCLYYGKFLLLIIESCQFWMKLRSLRYLFDYVSKGFDCFKRNFFLTIYMPSPQKNSRGRGWHCLWKGLDSC